MALAIGMMVALCWRMGGSVIVEYSHAMNAIEEMSALNSDLKRIFDQNNTIYDQWKSLENEVSAYLK